MWGLQNFEFGVGIHLFTQTQCEAGCFSGFDVQRLLKNAGEGTQDVSVD